jgi:hypothetical protein
MKQGLKTPRTYHSMVKILPCTCESKYQDKVYGEKKRVHNKTQQSKPLIKSYRCTVCGNIKGF